MTQRKESPRNPPRRTSRPRQISHLLEPTPDPTFIERRLAEYGYSLIAGVDEAGRGCLAGPVVAACVMLPPEAVIEGLKDSKKLTARQRDHYFGIIGEAALAWSWSSIDAREIDRINILKASLKAMERAVAQLSTRPQFLLIDGLQCIDTPLPQKALTKGDVRSQSIAAASVVAKVIRDRLMCDYRRDYPAFSFDVHKGYGTSRHLAELKLHGPTPIHRMSFRGVGSS